MIPNILGFFFLGFGIFLGLNELGRELRLGYVEGEKVKARLELILNGRIDQVHNL